MVALLGFMKTTQPKPSLKEMTSFSTLNCEVHAALRSVDESAV